MFFGWANNSFNYDVEIVTCGFTKEVISTFNIPIIVDKTIDEIDISEYSAIAIPGGFKEYGFYEDAYNERFLNLINDFNKQGKYIASICVGALPIGKSGVLKGRNATTYQFDNRIYQKQLAQFGVNVIPDERIVIDKNVITSFCPETAVDVAFTLLSLLVGDEKASVVSKAMGY